MPNITPPKWSLEKRGNKRIYMRYRWEGTKPRIDLEATNEADAKKAAAAYWVKWVEEQTAKAAKVEADALRVDKEASKHLVSVSVTKFLKQKFSGLNPKSMADANRNIGTLIRLSKVEYVEDFTKDIVMDALSVAIAEVKPKTKVSRKNGTSAWTVYALVKSWKQWFKWLANDDLISNRVFNELKASAPKTEHKQDQLWLWSEFQGIQALASDLDKELYLVLRFMGIDPADIYEMQKDHFKKKGNKWKFVKERAKKSELKTGTYSQTVDDRAMAVLLPRIQKAEGPGAYIFPELHRNEKGGYKDADSFVSSWGNRNDDYWDMLKFKCTKEGLTEIRKGKDYKKRIEKLPVRTILRKVIHKKTGIEFTSERAFNGGAKALPNCAAYNKERVIKVLHSLRYTYATSKVESGMDIFELRDAMGHSKDSRVLERFYNQRRDQDERIEEPLE